MAKIALDRDDWYVYLVSTKPPVGLEWQIDVPDEIAARWLDAQAAYEQVQHEIEEAVAADRARFRAVNPARSDA